MEQVQYKKLATLLRAWIIKMTTAAGSGHPSSSLSAVEAMVTLFFGGSFFYNTKHPKATHNDRIIFSKGHASPLFYGLWALAGEVTEEDLMHFRTFDSALEGHPTQRFRHTFAATGSLGQGLSIGAGAALAQKYLDKTTAATYVLLGDSECAEGQVYEAMQLAAHYKLGNLIALVDVNRLGQRGETMLGTDTERYRARAEAFGWKAVVVDGHDTESLLRVYRHIDRESDRPTMIIMYTIKGAGVAVMEDQDHWHGKVLSPEQAEEALAALGAYDETVRASLTPPEVAAVATDKELNDTRGAKMPQYNIGDICATRDAYGTGLLRLMEQDDRVIVLDAETSNSTRAARAQEAFPERFLEMYIAEQNMVGVAHGLSHMGYTPYLSTFAAFFTRAHDQLRMAALDGAHMVCVGSHAGVSIGEDGASQMGIDDIALFRALPNSTVLYPSDAVTTEQLVRVAATQMGVVYLRTTRGATPVIYENNEQHRAGELSVVRQSDADVATVIGAGETLHEALRAYDILERQGLPVRVIDLYSIAPLDTTQILAAADATDFIVVVEDHGGPGGMAEAVRTALAGHDTDVHTLYVHRVPRSGTPRELRAYEHIDADAIIECVEANVAAG